MKADQSQSKLYFYPAKSVLFFQLLLAVLCFLLVALLPILLWVKLSVLTIIVLVQLAIIIRFSKALSNKLVYKPSTDQWHYNGCRVYLETQQFVTRRLVIIYLVTESGKKITQVAPADSMSSQQHIALRKLLIDRIAASPSVRSHPEQQS